MHRVRFSLASLIALIVIVAVGCAALRNPSYLVASALLMVTMVILLLGIVGVVYSTGQGRAFLLGFVLFGWAHLLLRAIPFETFGRSLFDYALWRITPEVDWHSPGREGLIWGDGIQHLLATLVFAILGGWLAFHIHQRLRPQEHCTGH